MAQLALYLDEETARLLDKAAQKDGVSRSAWARQAIQAALENRLPQSFFDVLGNWEDNRSADQIMADIRQYPSDADRPKLD